MSRRGEVHVDTIGMSALAGGNDVGADTIFRISSMTKPVTALATLILLEECGLGIDEPRRTDHPRRRSQNKCTAERGHMLRSTFPTISDLAIGPQNRLSQEMPRLSPMPK